MIHRNASLQPGNTSDVVHRLEGGTGCGAHTTADPWRRSVVFLFGAIEGMNPRYFFTECVFVKKINVQYCFLSMNKYITQFYGKCSGHANTLVLTPTRQHRAGGGRGGVISDTTEEDRRKHGWRKTREGHNTRTETINRSRTGKIRNFEPAHFYSLLHYLPFYLRQRRQPSSRSIPFSLLAILILVNPRRVLFLSFLSYNPSL